MIRKHSNVIEEILIGALHLCILSPSDDWWLRSPHPSCEHTDKSDRSRLVCCFRTRDREGKKRTTEERAEVRKSELETERTGAKNKQRSEKPNSAVWFRFEPSVLCHVGETSHTSWCAELPSASPLSFLSPLPHLSLQNSRATCLFNLLSGHLLIFSFLILLDSLFFAFPATFLVTAMSLGISFLKFYQSLRSFHRSDSALWSVLLFLQHPQVLLLIPKHDVNKSRSKCEIVEIEWMRR